MDPVAFTGLPAVEERTVYAAFQRALAARPDAVAHIGRDGEWTFAEAYERSLRLGAGLQAQPGSNGLVAFLLDNSLDFVHSWLGVSLTGAIEVPVNTGYKGRFLTHLLNDSGAAVLVAEDGYCARLAAVADELSALHTVVVRGGDGAALAGTGLVVVPFVALETYPPAEAVRTEPSDLIAYMYTSGTTGQSKGVMIQHAHAYTYASREDQALPRAEDRILVTLPLFHLAGQWYGAYQALIHQARCVVEPGFSVRRFWAAVREHGITITVMLGAMAELLQQAEPAPDDADNPLRLAVMAPLCSDIDGFRRRFGLDLAAVYGMSEIGAVLNGPPETLMRGEAGRSRPGYELRLVTPDGRTAATDEVGELWARAEVPFTTMAGYHNRPEQTAETMVDGWVHTGDAFRCDAGGHFYFTDRMKDALRRKGENISSFEVESVINEHPAVYESAVVGVPSELTEDEIKATVVVRAGQQIDPVDLITFLTERLPYFMVPRYVEFVAELPKTPTLKIQKHLLRDRPVTAAVWDREAAGIVVNRSS